MGKSLGVDTEKIVELSRRHGVIFLGVFGSVATGEAAADSDVDLLISFHDPKGLLDLIRIEREISESIGRDVDLLTEESISPYLKERIFRELKALDNSRSRCPLTG